MYNIHYGCDKNVAVHEATILSDKTNKQWETTGPAPTAHDSEEYYDETYRTIQEKARRQHAGKGQTDRGDRPGTGKPNDAIERIQRRLYILINRRFRV